jgi:two-component sensor histidine kinase
VDAIAHRTAAENPADFAERFSERIRVLSANQDLLFRNEWMGVAVEDLAHVQLPHFADLIGSRIVVRGPKLRFNTVGAQAVGLALHELATNASKYEAFSTDRGRVEVGWNFSERRLHHEFDRARGVVRVCANAVRVWDETYAVRPGRKLPGRSFMRCRSD